MRIVAVADTHLFHADLKTLPEGDVFVHAGDLLRGGSLDELRLAVEWLQQLPYAHKVVIAGNHDWCFSRHPEQAQELLGPTAIYLQDSGATVDGVRFWGSPWQPEYNSWAFNLPRGEPLAEKWQLIPDGIDVLITHGPPHDIGDNSGMVERAGCSELLKAVSQVRPLVHMFGHIHQDGGFWRLSGTCFANVTTWECERGPTILDIDVETGRVVEVEVPPARRNRQNRSG